MRKTITGAEQSAHLAGIRASAWRFERQPFYFIEQEDRQLRAFLTGHPIPPHEDIEHPELGEWMQRVVQYTAEGKSIGRVRVTDEPPTDYQRWLRWLDTYNRAAGEDIRYVTRQAARDSGLLVDENGPDWWLLDNERLILIHFDGGGRITSRELVEGDRAVAEALDLRTKAIRAAADRQDEATVGFLHEACHLKQTPRAGWLIAGVRDPESVAEHSFRVGVLAYVLAVMEGANPDRAAALALFHDVPEARTTDLHSVAKPHVQVTPDPGVIELQTAHLPGDLAAPIRALIAEFAAKVTLEALCAKDADKLECLLQAREYQAAGNQQVQPWIDTMLVAVKTVSGRRLAEAAVKTSVDAWWHDIVASYGK
jgi:putative hydrolase of HD superfamily